MDAYELIEALQNHAGYQVIVRGYELITTPGRNAEIVQVTLDEEHKTLIINVVEQDEEGFGTVIDYTPPVERNPRKVEVRDKPLEPPRRAFFWDDDNAEP